EVRNLDAYRGHGGDRLNPWHALDLGRVECSSGYPNDGRATSEDANHARPSLAKAWKSARCTFMNIGSTADVIIRRVRNLRGNLVSTSLVLFWAIALPSCRDSERQSDADTSQTGAVLTERDTAENTASGRSAVQSDGTASGVALPAEPQVSPTATQAATSPPKVRKSETRSPDDVRSLPVERQQAILVALLTDSLELSAPQVERVRAIVAGSKWLSFGNPD